MMRMKPPLFFEYFAIVISRNLKWATYHIHRNKFVIIRTLRNSVLFTFASYTKRFNRNIKNDEVTFHYIPIFFFDLHGICLNQGQIFSKKLRKIRACMHGYTFIQNILLSSLFYFNDYFYHRCAQLQIFNATQSSAIVPVTKCVKVRTKAT
jgi:hypothetical protein